MKKSYSLILVGFFIVFSLLIKYPIEKETELDDLVGKIIDFTAIFSALLITFIISKAYQIRQEKNILIQEALPLSNKVTYLRSIAHILITYDFFNTEMKRNIDNRFPNLTIIEYNDTSGKYEEIQNEISNEEGKDSEDYKYYGFRLYMKFKALVSKRVVSRDADRKLTELDKVPKRIHWSEETFLYLDTARDKLYPFFFIDACVVNNVASFGINKTPNRFTLGNIPKEPFDRILTLAVKIDEKFKNRPLTLDLLDEIGNDFESSYLPKLWEKMYEIEKGADRLLITLLNSLLIIVLFGVVIPLIISSIGCNFFLKRAVVYICFLILLILISYFIVELKRMILSVIKPKKNKYIRVH
ncbi:MAG: hypothetical protein F9K23_16520 [Bacteroidetes bacterium]|nr:MAG: hypothetical protein F9K23_16520 [Bacteroidota bacterium]